MRHREAGRDGPHVGRRGARDPQPAGRHRAGQRAARRGPAPTPGSTQLTRMVAENAQRLKRIVDDVLDVAPGATEAVPAHRRPRRGRRRPALDWRRARRGRRWPAAACCGSTLPAEPIGVRVRRRAPAPRAGQPARQRARAMPASAPARSWSACTAATSTRRRCSVWSDGAPLDRPVSSATCSSPSSRRESRASGLGLYICRELCERHGATIGFRAHPGRPSGCATSSRSRCAARHGPGDGAAGCPGGAAARCRSGRRRRRAGRAMTASAAPRLLVVDDEPDLRTLYELTLLREGYDVEAAGSVERGAGELPAAAALRRGDHRHAPARRHRAGPAGAARSRGAQRAVRSSSPPTARPRTPSRR